MKYNTIRTYKSIIEKYLQQNIGQYRLSGLTGYQLNNFIIELCNRYDYSRDYIRNILKVLKASFRDATDLYGFINYNPTFTIKVPTKNEMGLKKCRFYDLRGTYATKILRSGIEIRDVADLLGHSKIETTENYYITSTEETRKKASMALESIIKSEVINKIINFEEFPQKD